MAAAGITNFDFYLRFAKPLVLNLAEPNERVLAAAWIQKLRNPEVGDEKLRTDYLKLLLFVLQRRRLAGPFTENPGQNEKLEEFPETYNLQDVAKALIEADEAEKRDRMAKGLGGPSGDYPPYTTEYSADLLEYSAAQDIPNFGVHVYYAISTDPLPLWDNAEKGHFPKSAMAKIDATSVLSVSVSTSTVFSEMGAVRKSRSKSKERSSSRSRSKSAKGGDRSSPISKRQVSPRKKGPPTSPLGDTAQPAERTPPTWGSNLIEVSEPPTKADDRVSSSPSEDVGFSYHLPPPKTSEIQFWQPPAAPTMLFQSSPQNERSEHLSQQIANVSGAAGPYISPQGEREYDVQELKEYGITEDLLKDDYLNLDELDELQVSDISSVKDEDLDKFSPYKDDRLDAFDRMLDEFEKEEFGMDIPVSPEDYKSPVKAIPPPSPKSKPTGTRKTTATVKVVKSTPVETKPKAGPSKTPQAVKKMSKTVVKKTSKPAVPSPKETTQLPEQQIQLPRKTTTPKAVSPRPIPAATSVTGQPAKRGIPLPTQRPAGTGIPIGRGRPPSAKAPASKLARPVGTRIPGAGARTIQKKSITIDENVFDVNVPLLPQAGMNLSPIFLENLPSFYEEPSSAELSGDLSFRGPSPRPYVQSPYTSPSLPYRTPPRAYPDMADLSAPSLPYRTPPRVYPDMADLSAPSLPYLTPPMAAVSEYDEEQLALLGLNPEDLADIDLDVEDIDIEDVSISSDVEYEEFPDFDDKKIEDDLEKWERKIAELEAEHAEDLALFGDMALSPLSSSGGGTSPLSVAEQQYVAALETSPKRPTPIRIPMQIPHIQIHAASPPPARTPMQIPHIQIHAASPVPARIPMQIPHIQIHAASPEAQEIIEEANQELETLDDIYRRLQPNRREDMDRTPPIFSKYREIREAGAGMSYKPQDFGLSEDAQWQHAPDFFEGQIAFSPYKDPRQPVGEALPETRARLNAEGLLYAEEEPQLIDDASIAKRLSPSHHLRDFAKRINKMVSDIVESESVSPAMGGLPLTTPRRSPSPRRPKLGEESPVILESPQGSEWDSLSPESRYFNVLEQHAESMPGLPGTFSPDQIAAPPRSPARPQPISTSPTAAARAEQQYQRLLTVTPPQLQQTLRASPDTRIKHDAHEAIAQQQYQQLHNVTPPHLAVLPAGTPQQYQQFVIEEQGPLPHVFDEPLPQLPAAIQPLTGVPGWKTPERMKPAPIIRTPSPPLVLGALSKEQYLRYEELPEDDLNLSVPTPPSPFEWEGKTTPERVDAFDIEKVEDVSHYSPPIAEVLEAHEYVAEFFDPERPLATKQIITRGGKRIALQRKAPRPTVSPISEQPEIFAELLPSPEKLTFKKPEPYVMPGRQLKPAQELPGLPAEEERYIQHYVAPERQEFVRRLSRRVIDVADRTAEAQGFVPTSPELPQTTQIAIEGVLTTSPPQEIITSPTIGSPTGLAGQEYVMPDFQDIDLAFEMPSTDEVYNIADKQYAMLTDSPPRAPALRPSFKRVDQRVDQLEDGDVFLNLSRDLNAAFIAEEGIPEYIVTSPTGSPAHQVAAIRTPPRRAPTPARVPSIDPIQLAAQQYAMLVESTTVDQRMIQFRQAVVAAPRIADRREIRLQQKLLQRHAPVPSLPTVREQLEYAVPLKSSPRRITTAQYAQRRPAGPVPRSRMRQRRLDFEAPEPGMAPAIVPAIEYHPRPRFGEPQPLQYDVPVTSTTPTRFTRTEGGERRQRGRVRSAGVRRRLLDFYAPQSGTEMAGPPLREYGPLPEFLESQPLEYELPITITPERPQEDRVSTSRIRKRRLDFNEPGAAGVPPAEYGPRPEFFEGQPLSPSPGQILSQRMFELPPLPLPEDLMGAASAVVYQPDVAEWEASLPQDTRLQEPLRPPTVLPGWRTPERFKANVDPRRIQQPIRRPIPQIQVIVPTPQIPGIIVTAPTPSPSRISTPPAPPSPLPPPESPHARIPTPTKQPSPRTPGRTASSNVWELKAVPVLQETELPSELATTSPEVIISPIPAGMLEAVDAMIQLENIPADFPPSPPTIYTYESELSPASPEGRFRQAVTDAPRVVDRRQLRLQRGILQRHAPAPALSPVQEVEYVEPVSPLKRAAARVAEVPYVPQERQPLRPLRTYDLSYEEWSPDMGKSKEIIPLEHEWEPPEVWKTQYQETSPKTPTKTPPKPRTPTPPRRAPPTPPRMRTPTPPKQAPASPATPELRIYQEVVTEEILGEVTPPLEESPKRSPLTTTPPTPPTQFHYDEYRSESPPHSASEIRQMIEKHEYTERHQDIEKKLMTTHINVGRRHVPLTYARKPDLQPIIEMPTEVSPRRNVIEEEIIHISPPLRQPTPSPGSPLNAIEFAAQQYASLRDTPPKAADKYQQIIGNAITREEFEKSYPILDRPLGQADAYLPAGVMDQGLGWVSPPARSPLKVRSPHMAAPYVPPHRQVTQFSPPVLYGAPEEDVPPTSPFTEQFAVTTADDVIGATDDVINYVLPFLENTPEDYQSPVLGYTPGLHGSPTDSPNFMQRYQQLKNVDAHLGGGRVQPRASSVIAATDDVINYVLPFLDDTPEDYQSPTLGYTPELGRSPIDSPTFMQRYLQLKSAEVQPMVSSGQRRIRQPIVHPPLGPPIYATQTPPSGRKRYSPAELPSPVRFELIPPGRQVQVEQPRQPVATPTRQAYRERMGLKRPALRPRKIIFATAEPIASQASVPLPQRISPVQQQRYSPQPSTSYAPAPSRTSPGSRYVQEVVVETEDPWTLWAVPAFDYEVAAPFGGRTSPGILDTSEIGDTSFIDEEAQDFKWMG